MRGRGGRPRLAGGPITAVAAVVRKNEGRDAREVALKRQDQQIAQEPQVFLVIARNAQRPRVLCNSDIDRRPGTADAFFELADAGYVFIELAAIGGADA